VQQEVASLSLRRKTELLKVTRSKLYYQPKARPNEDKIIEKILDIYEAHPIYGYRRMTAILRRQGVIINHKKVRKLMKMLNLKAIYPGPNTSKKNHADMVHPYLIKDLAINRFNQVWQTDISYIRVGNGFMYLTGIVDVYSRKALSYRISNSLNGSACIDALEDAVSKYGAPEIINSDQGSQYTSDGWSKKVKDLDIKISMTGKGRCNDNAYIERFWRTVKYEWLKLKFIPTVDKLKTELANFMTWYNNERPHQGISYLTPAEKSYGFMDKFYNLPTIPQAQQQQIS
jgi:putative transposase